MDLHGFADIRTYRVRMPDPLFPFRGRESIEPCDDITQTEMCESPSLPQRNSGWLGIEDLTEFFPSKFSEKNDLNMPGPIYGGETDTCCTGPQEAPDNVLLDKEGQEFVFKQPSTAVEFRDLVSAALSECFEGYGADGDSHWRLASIRDWWRTREDMLLGGISEQWCEAESVMRWKRALQGEAEGYLRVYAFFVENGRVPVDGDTLPNVA